MSVSEFRSCFHLILISIAISVLVQVFILSSLGFLQYIDIGVATTNSTFLNSVLL